MKLKLVDEIIDGATSASEPLADLLRKCLVLAYRLRNEPLKAWAEGELNGYDGRDDLPSYRTLTTRSKGLFVGAFGAQIRDQPLASAILAPEHQHWATTTILRQPIAAYGKPDPAQNMQVPWPADLIVLYQESFIDGYALNRAYQEVPGTVISGLVDTVRTRILTFALEISAELPEDTEIAVDRIPPATVDRLVNVVIMGGNNVIGDVSEFSASTVLAGDISSLRAALGSLGVAPEDLRVLEATIHEESGALKSAPSKGLGERTLKWIAETAKKGTKKGAQIGAAVLEEAIKRAVFGYFGL